MGKKQTSGSNDKEREDQNRRKLFHSRGEETKLRAAFIVRAVVIKRCSARK